MKVWILTEEYNDYDQHGEYFVTVFFEKPSLEKIQKETGLSEDGAAHVQAGGGRQNSEYHWYNLTEMEPT